MATGAARADATWRSAIAGGVAPGAGTVAGTGAGGAWSDAQSAGDGEAWDGLAGALAFEAPAADVPGDALAGAEDPAGVTAAVGAGVAATMIAAGVPPDPDTDADDPHAAISIAAISVAAMRPTAVKASWANARVAHG